MSLFPIKTPWLAVLSAVAISSCATIAPQPLSESDMGQQVKNDIAHAFVEQEPVGEPLFLEEAIARAIKYNLERKVKLMEEELARDQVLMEKLNLLPTLALKVEHTARNNYQINNSENLNTGVLQVNNSASSQKSHTIESARLVWNVLDFGVSYIAAKQATDKELIARERKRLAVQNMTRDVRTSYWRAVGSQLAQKDIDQLIDQTHTALMLATKSETDLLENPREALQYQRSLLEILAQLRETQAAINASQVQLATLMGMPPTTQFRLVTPPQHINIPQLKMDITTMEAQALFSNPDLRAAHYESRISINDVKKEILRQYPGLELSFGLNNDNNKFLQNQQWTQAGISLSWNLFNLFTAPKKIKNAQLKKKLVDAQRKALSVALLTRLYIGHAQYKLAIDEFELAQCLYDVTGRIHNIDNNKLELQALSGLDIIRSQADLARMRMNKYLKYADLQDSIARLKMSVGLDPLPATIHSHELTELIRAVRTTWNEQEEMVPASLAYCPVTELLPQINSAPPVVQDSDEDGISDSHDLCPTTPIDMAVNTVGCVPLYGVTFKTNSAELNGPSIVLLNKAAQQIKRNAQMTVEIAGHTDDTSSPKYNQSLSLLRAQTVREHLISWGIQPDRLTATGYGKSQPIASNNTLAGRLENRRVELRYHEQQ